MGALCFGDEGKQEPVLGLREIEMRNRLIFSETSKLSSAIAEDLNRKGRNSEPEVK